jgi:hypothetical protein
MIVIFVGRLVSKLSIADKIATPGALSPRQTLLAAL